MSFWTINAVLGAALYMPYVLRLYGCPLLDFGSKYLPKHCLDQESLQGELINLAMYCERIRRRFWPEWFVDLEDFCYTDSTEGSTSPSKLPDLGLFSCTDSFHDCTHTHTSHTQTPQDPPSPISDPTGHSLYDSDMDTECSEMDQLKC